MKLLYYRTTKGIKLPEGLIPGAADLEPDNVYGFPVDAAHTHPWFHLLIKNGSLVPEPAMPAIEVIVEEAQPPTLTEVLDALRKHPALYGAVRHHFEGPLVLKFQRILEEREREWAEKHERARGKLGTADADPFAGATNADVTAAEREAAYSEDPERAFGHELRRRTRARSTAMLSKAAVAEARSDKAERVYDAMEKTALANLEASEPGSLLGQFARTVFGR